MAVFNSDIREKLHSLLAIYVSLTRSKMADNDFVDELTVEHRKRTVVGNAFKRILLLFDVLVNFSRPERKRC